MAIAQSGLDQWTTGQVTRQSPPIKQEASVPPETSTQNGLYPSALNHISFELSSPTSKATPPFYTSPASSFPSSEVQTPNTFEHMHQPFFAFHSPGSFSSKSPSMLDQSPSSFNSPLTYTGQASPGKRGSSYGRHSIHVLRRLSHSAVFPSRAGGRDSRGRSHLEGLDKRYCKFGLKVVLLTLTS